MGEVEVEAKDEVRDRDNRKMNGRKKERIR